MFKKPSLTRKKMAALAKAQEQETIGDSSPVTIADFQPPPFRVKTVLPEHEPSPKSSTQLKTTAQLHRERMQAAERLVGSSMSNYSKTALGSPQTWDPFEGRSFSRTNFPDLNEFSEQLKIHRAASELKRIGENATSRVTKSGRKVKVPGKKVEESNANTVQADVESEITKGFGPFYSGPKTGAGAKAKPAKEHDAKTVKKPEVVKAAQPRPSPVTARKEPLVTSRKVTSITARKQVPETARNVRKPEALETARKTRKPEAPVTARQVPTAVTVRKGLSTTARKPTNPIVTVGKAGSQKILIQGLERKKKADVSLENIFGPDESEAIEDTQGPKPKKKVVDKKKANPPKMTLIADAPDSEDTNVSFAAVLKRSAAVPPLRKSSTASGTNTGGRKSFMGVQDLTVTHGYVHFSADDPSHQHNTFGSPRETRKPTTRSGGDANKNQERFHYEVNMEGFEDDEIFFQTDDTALIINAVRPKKGNKNARKVTEVVDFPDEVYPEALRISRNPQGLLIIDQQY